MLIQISFTTRKCWVCMNYLNLWCPPSFIDIFNSFFVPTTKLPSFDKERIFAFLNMPRFTTIIKTADRGLSEFFAKNLQLDEKNSRSEFFQADPSKVQTAVQVSHTGDNSGYQKNTQLQEAHDPVSANVDKTIQHVIPINPQAILLRPKARPRIKAFAFLPRHGAIHQQRHNQHHRRYPKTENFLRCHYAPWAPATTMTSELCAVWQHFTTPPPPLRFTSTMTPFGLGKRRRVDWSSVNDNVASEVGSLDTIMEE